MKELTINNIFQLVSLVNNGIVNTKLTKTVVQEVTNLQHNIINNLINKVNDTDELNDLCVVFDRVCNMLEQPAGKYSEYRTVFEDNYFMETGIPDDAKIRLVEEQNNLYCHTSKKLTDKEKWDIAQNIRALINLMQFWDPEE